MLGASLGVYKHAQDALDNWFNFLNFHPMLHYDVLMPCDEDIVPHYKMMMPDPISKDYIESEVIFWDVQTDQ